MTRRNIIAFCCFVATFALVPLFASGSYALGVGIFAGINALVALGLCVLMGYAGQVSLGQAGFYGIGAYISGILSVKVGLPVVVTIAAGAFVAAGAAVVLAIPALRLKGHYLAIATLGFGEIVHILLNEWGPGGPSGFGDIPKFSIGGMVFESSTSYFYLVWTVVAIAVVFSFNLLNSRIGRALRAIHDSEAACSAMGIEVATLKIKVFVLSAVYAAVAGGLYAHFVLFLSPSTFSLVQSVLIVMMAVVGGISTVWGGIVGAVIITILPEALRVFQEYDTLAYGLILTLSLLFFRKGLVPIITGIVRKVTGRA